MTVPTTSRSAGPLFGNGVTLVFPFSFKVFSKTDIKVVKTTAAGSTLLVQDLDYVVTINPDQTTSPGGHISTASAPLTSLESVMITGATPYSQTLALPAGGNFNPVAIEQALDRLEFQIQQLRVVANGTLRAPEGESVVALPAPAQRANRVMAFDSLGAPSMIVGVDAGSAAALSLDLLDSTLLAKGDALVSTKRAATGAVARSLHSWIELQPLNVKDFGAVGDGATNDTAAIAAAAAALQAAGGGALLFPPGNYRVWPDLPGTVLCSFSSLSNVAIHSQGAKMTVGYGWSGSETQVVWQFTDCKNLYLDLPELVSTVQPVGQRATRGPKMLYLAGNCEGVTIPRIRATGALWVVGAAALSTATEAERTRGVSIGTGYADRCGYGMSWQFSGDDVHVGQWVSAGPHRSYFPYGVRNHVVNIESWDQDADDCLLRAFEGKGLDNIEVNYTNTRSTAAQAAAPCVSVAFGDQTPATIRDVRINVRAHWPATGYFGHALHVYKNNNSGGYDTSDRGHTLAGLRFTGVLTSAYSSAVPIRFCADGTWGSGETVAGLCVRDVTITGADACTVQLSSAKDPAHFENIDTSAGFYVQGAPATAPAKVLSCKAANFTSGTGDAGFADYIYSEATAGTLQSTTNKTFAEFTVAGVLVREFGRIGRGLLVASNTKNGDLTGTNNIFFVKLVGGLGAYFRLRYALVADQSDSNPATRDETYGCKSFSATMNGSGVWVSQTATANEVTERTLGTASVVSVSLVNGTSAGAHIAVACTNYNGANARASYVLEVMPMGLEAVLTNRCEAV